MIAFAISVFEYSVAAFATVVVIFQLLFFFVIVPRITENQKELKGDAFFGTGQAHYARTYLELLSTEEQHRWYNIVIRYSRSVQLIIFAIGMVALAVSWL